MTVVVASSVASNWAVVVVAEKPVGMVRCRFPRLSVPRLLIAVEVD